MLRLAADGPHDPRDRDAAVHLGEDRRAPHPEHLHEDRRVQPGGGDALGGGARRRRLTSHEWGELRMRRASRPERRITRCHSRPIGGTMITTSDRSKEKSMILATTKVADWRPVPGRLQHDGRREARRARLQGRDRVPRRRPTRTACGSLFDWDDAGWASFVSDPTVPPVIKEAGHLDKPRPRRFLGASRREGRTMTHDQPIPPGSGSSPTRPARCPSWASPTPTSPRW